MLVKLTACCAFSVPAQLHGILRVFHLWFYILVVYSESLLLEVHSNNFEVSLLLYCSWLLREGSWEIAPFRGSTWPCWLPLPSTLSSSSPMQQLQVWPQAYVESLSCSNFAATKFMQFHAAHVHCSFVACYLHVMILCGQPSRANLNWSVCSWLVDWLTPYAKVRMWHMQSTAVLPMQYRMHCLLPSCQSAMNSP